jgi:hypothetical protein
MVVGASVRIRDLRPAGADVNRALLQERRRQSPGPLRHRSAVVLEELQTHSSCLRGFGLCVPLATSETAPRVQARLRAHSGHITSAWAVHPDDRERGPTQRACRLGGGRGRLNRRQVTPLTPGSATPKPSSGCTWRASNRRLPPCGQQLHRRGRTGRQRGCAAPEANGALSRGAVAAPRTTGCRLPTARPEGLLKLGGLRSVITRRPATARRGCLVTDVTERVIDVEPHPQAATEAPAIGDGTHKRAYSTQIVLINLTAEHSMH